MRQVPNVAIIGSGRMARHFNHYLALSGVVCPTWDRRSASAFSVAIGDAATVLLLIRDSAIEPFIAERAAELAGRRLIHFSGSLVSAGVSAMHPLMTFGESLYSLAEYQAIPFVCDERGPVLGDVFPFLLNPCHRLPAERRALYHSLCVMSGNFTTILWKKFFGDLESRLGLPREIALPYLQRIAKNLETDPDGALTGPLQRGDRRTIESNLEALKGDPYRKVYEAFVEAAK